MRSFVIDHKGNPNVLKVIKSACGFIQQLPKDKKWEIVIKPYRFKRTLAQNNYLWGVVYKAIEEDEGGYFLHEGTQPMLRVAKISDKEFIHEHFKQQYLAVGKIGDTVITRSTADLSTSEFTEYVEKIMRFAATVLGIYIPTPADQGLADYQKWWAGR